MYDFEYHRPTSVDAAIAAATQLGKRKLLAGGMSLLPALKQRLARHAGLVDLNAIAALKGIERDGQDLVIGAMTAHAVVAASSLVSSTIPALAVLAGGIGDPLVRNRGTIGGSIANADPAADYPAAVLGLDATVVTNQRCIAAAEFFTGLFETALRAGEIITAVRFPLPLAAGYAKFRQPASRFALVGVFVARTTAGVRVAVTGARPAVFRWTQAESTLSARFDAAAIDTVELSGDDMNADMHASAEYRTHCVRVMAKRAALATR
jgi:carbon-monoxide dehydrogenase medium subunit